MTEEKKEPRINRSLSGEEVAHADYVRIAMASTGILLIFGQGHPDKKDEVLCIKEIFLPPMVAGQLLPILAGAIKGWEQLTGQKASPGVEIEIEVEGK